MVSENSIDKYINCLLDGDKGTAARIMSAIENEDEIAHEYLPRLYQVAGKSHVVGVTGWPGVGKSTLVTGIARSFLEEDKSVGIIATDPSSPFSGGSFLGDRERIREIDGNERLFIRSVATRGSTGGIAGVTKDFIKVLEVMGKDVIILETVGVGQDQVAVMGVADTIVLTLMPGMGDYLQSLKAGVLEIGDIIVANKADREGIKQTVADIKALIDLRGSSGLWKPPIIETIAINGSGIKELVVKIKEHGQYIKDGKLLGLRLGNGKGRNS